jgi:SAM-dependent methyltransferase
MKIININKIFLIVVFFLCLFSLSCKNKASTNIKVKAIVLDRIEKTCELYFPVDFDKRYQKVEKGYFAPSHLFDINECFNEFLKPGSRFIDLGSGDGRVVFLASLYGTDSFGVEYNPTLYSISIKARSRLSDIISINNVHFIKKDGFLLDLSHYDVLYVFGYSEELEKKLFKEMKNNALLISFHEARPYKILKLIKDFPSKRVKVYKRVKY